MSNITTNHREELKGKMPKGYRQALALKFKVSTSTVDKVLGGEMKDLRGIVEEAYRTCIKYNKNNKKTMSNIDKLRLEVQRI